MNYNTVNSILPIVLLLILLEIKLTIAVMTSGDNLYEAKPTPICQLSTCSSHENPDTGIPSTSTSDMFETILDNHKRKERQINDVVEAELPQPTEVLDKLFSRVLFNTTMNYIVPLMKVTLPMHTDQGSTVHLAMQAFLGLFSAIVWVSTLAVPFLLTQANPFGIGTIGVRRGFPEFLQTFSFNWKLGSIINESTAKKIGIQWDPCLDKTICEAHRSPETYRWFAFPFLVLYPAANSTGPGNSVSNSHAKAAFHGSFSDEECEKLYHCFYDVLPLAKYLLYACTH